MTREPSDDLLSFAFFGTPRRLLRPVLDNLDGRSIRVLSAEEAAVVIEGVVYWQWVRTGLFGLIGGSLLVVQREWHFAAQVLWEWLGATILLILPAYMIVLGVLHQIL